MKKTISLLMAVLIIVSLMTACGSAATDSVGYAEEIVYSTGSGKNQSQSLKDSIATSPEAPRVEMESAETDYAADAQFTSVSMPKNVKLIYRARIDMETTEFDQVAAGLETLVASVGGYFESSSLDNYSSYRYGHYTVRVPAENFESFCSQIGQLCKVNNISRSAEDISENYYDTESRLVTQRTKLERLQELLEQAENMEDIITLESAISETELAIENLTGTLRKYDSLVGYSTVNISLSEVYKLSDVEQPVIGFGAKLAQAFETGCSRFVNNLEDMLLSFARGWVGWLIFIVIAVVVVMFAARTVKKRRTRKLLRGKAPENEAEETDKK